MRQYLFITTFITILFCVSLNAQELKPLDGFRLTIYNIPDNISGDYLIQKDSTLQLPFLGNLSIAHKDQNTIIEEIIKGYKIIYRDPEITVQPLYRVIVLGEVKNPGQYYFIGVENITDIIAKAGGETLDADLSDVIVTRDDTEISVDAKEILENGDQASDIKSLPGDKIYVTKKWLGGAQNTNIILYGVAILVAVASLFIK